MPLFQGGGGVLAGGGLSPGECGPGLVQLCSEPAEIVA